MYLGRLRSPEMGVRAAMSTSLARSLSSRSAVAVASSMSMYRKAANYVPRSALACAGAGGHKSWAQLQDLRKVVSGSFDSGLTGDTAGVDEEFVRRMQDMAGGEEVAVWQASVERRASAVGLPVSLRMLKKKKQLVGAASESVSSSVRRAFSSLVFIIRELHRFALQMRESLPFEELHSVLTRVQAEMHASFVWLFQHIFAATPSLMVSVMLFLANFTVYSMGNTVVGVATAATIPTPLLPSSSSVVVVEETDCTHSMPRLDHVAVKTTSIGGKINGGGGGGKIKSVAGAADDSRSDKSSPSLYRKKETVIPDAAMTSAGPALTIPADELAATEGKLSLADRLAVERNYQRAVTEDPGNSLILSNFAQFLFVVLGDYDRAEHYFRRAAEAQPADGEALSRYATFLWKARGDLEAAEETFQLAIAADPENTFHAGNYALFLWNTGGEDTCFPLDCINAA